MENHTDRKSVEEIRALLENINQAWLNKRTDELANFFHRNVVIAQPGLGARAKGRRACINSYKEFASQAVTRNFKTSSYVIDFWGKTAVASYRFMMDYEIQGALYHDEGEDVFVFVREDEKWIVVWRTIIPLPQEESK